MIGSKNGQKVTTQKATSNTTKTINAPLKTSTPVTKTGPLSSSGTRGKLVLFASKEFF